MLGRKDGLVVCIEKGDSVPDVGLEEGPTDGNLKFDDGACDTEGAISVGTLVGAADLLSLGLDEYVGAAEKTGIVAFGSIMQKSVRASISEPPKHPGTSSKASRW